jgi:hypothetical protein
MKPEVVVLQKFDDAAILYEAEHFWIAYFRAMGCPLTNGTDGGPGAQGYRHTPDSKRRIGRAIGVRGWTAAEVEKRASKRRKPIVDQNGRVYAGINAAGRELGISAGHIGDVLRGRIKQTLGYTFKYL